MTHGHETAVPTDFGDIDVDGFCAAIDRLKAEAHANIGPADLAHLRRIEGYGRVATFLGYATAWIIPNPLSAFLLSLGQFTRWLLAHHILHRGYDRVPDVPRRYTSQVFARGWRRSTFVGRPCGGCGCTATPPTRAGTSWSCRFSSCRSARPRCWRC